MKTLKALRILIISVLLQESSASYAVDAVQLPPVNLGDTNFLDGVAGPGTLIQAFATYISADQFNDSSGDSLPGDNNIDVSVLLAQYAHITRHQLLGGYYGFEVLLPLLDVDPNTTLAPLPNEGERGMGDLIVSPFLLQWTDSSLFGRRYFHRLNMVFVLPTGDYDDENEVNVSSNVYSFNPYYAGTLFVNENISTSFRLHYLWNSKNDKPVGQFEDTQAGTATHLNFATTYLLGKRWRVGFGGYYLKQLTKDRIDGTRQKDSEEQVFAIGPGLFYQNKSHHCSLNGYFESQVENRSEGYRVVARCGIVL